VCDNFYPMSIISSSLLPALLLLASCSDPSAPSAGSRVQVQFRRDALGGGMSSPVPPLSSRHNGVTVALTGELAVINDDWIALDSKSERHWIPIHSVLLLTEALK
jgi:hypothetical protein